jgi:SAM-dependent methyltransferase
MVVQHADESGDPMASESETGSQGARLLASAKRKLPLVRASRGLSSLSRKAAASAHRLQYVIEWSVDNPEYFDHFIDSHYQWHAMRQSFPWERGVYSSLALQATRGDSLPKVLELCCGDGFMTYHFYSLQSSSIVSMDFDPEAIDAARRNCSAPNIKYLLGDIRTDMPSGQFDNIIWDAAIEHFTEDEIKGLMSSIKERLAPGGIVSGYTIVEPEHGGKHLHQHEYEFHDKADLARFLEPWFKNVQVFQTVFPSRTNLYFFASDGDLPMDRPISMTVRKQG